MNWLIKLLFGSDDQQFIQDRRTLEIAAYQEIMDEKDRHIADLMEIMKSRGIC